MVSPFISHSIGPYMVGRGLPVVPPLVWTLVGMDLQALAHGTVDEAERRVLLLVLLDVVGIERRQLGDVVDAPDVARLDAGGLPAALVEPVLPAGLHQVEELLVLERADLVGRPFPARVREHVGHRIALVERIPIDRAVIDRQRGDGLGVDHVHLDLSIAGIADIRGRMHRRARRSLRARRARARVNHQVL